MPARNEAERLPVLLGALAAQDWLDPVMVSIGVNNTSDDSLDVIGRAQRRYGARLDIAVVVADFAPELAHAGSARKLAMDAGLSRIAMAGDGVLVSTDADSRPPVDWLRNIAKAVDRGADMVGGRI
ncbi:MAG: glycosyltransferase, partial [Alphaproteobacteria bacterium]